MKIDLDKNSTMQTLAHLPSVDCHGTEGDVIKNLLDGMNLQETSETLTLSLFSFILGQHYHLNLNSEEALLLQTFRELSDVQRVGLWKYLLSLND